ncbi:DUF87 domain-containing protein [Shewanella sp. SNU WT4]|uniref:DNA translocase FtsK n=1 Tax=Shewanella sp. SNU WT4 TaxID=2590015 RepID=UPI00112A08AA|nr:DNA translocase FtsK 4TM domain-containing protein [Shewanella sp. SNU WT4]QDF67082.1 DUF87 domain-containing protein [Shewanella sp. SNU WT4]
MSQGTQSYTLSGLQRLLEGALLCCCIFAAFILLSLTSFDPADPGWSQTHFQGEINNLTGAVGAWIADVLFYFFGYTAYLVPIMVALTGWLLFKRAYRLLEIDYFSVGLRLVGFLLVIMGIAALASMNASDIYAFSAGGVCGDVIVGAMLPYFNPLGTTLLLLSFVGAGFTLLTGISLMTIVEWVGQGSIWCFEQLRQLPSYLASEKLASNRDSEDTKGFMSLVAKFKSQVSSQRDDSNDKPDFDYDQMVKNQVTYERKHQDVDSEPLVDDDHLRFDDPTQHDAEPNFDADTHSYSQANNKDDTFDVGFSALDSDTPWDDEPDAPKPNSENDYADDNLSANAEDIVDALDDVYQSPIKPAKQAKIVDGIVVIDGQSVVPPRPSTPLPCISLLDVPNRSKNPISEEELEQIARLVELKLADFNISAQVVGVFPGPVVTRFELELAPGIKASKITNLANDLARSLLAERVRVVEVIPGKAYVGLELPNKFRETVFMRDVLDSDTFRQSQSPLSMVLGQDISGEPVIADLGKMPHLLVAGTTGSGKSVGVNVMITSLLYKSTPEDVRFIMIDPKMLELSVYEGIPHLLCEVVTDMKDAANALRWCVGEMERRYKLMSAMGVRNLKGYNAKIAHAKEHGQEIPDPLWKSSESMLDEAPALEKLPALVVVVDEFADMMMIVGKKVEELITRIAQKARAAGIHLILATQRPSVDVITGLIKANIPTRIAFQVSSRIDSRTILDQQGAENLLGMGDMLYLPPGTSVPTRVHGAFIDDHEVHKVVADWKARGTPQYIDEILQGSSDGEQVLLPGETSQAEEDIDPLYDEAVAFVTETRRGSISSVQRKFKIGYNRAARIIEQMEAQGVVSSQGHNGNREVLAPPPPRH